MQFVNVGFSSLLSVSRIVAVVGFVPAPIRRMSQEAKAERKLIDATFGRKIQSLIVMDCGYIVVSSLTADEIQKRIDEG